MQDGYRKQLSDTAGALVSVDNPCKHAPSVRVADALQNVIANGNSTFDTLQGFGPGKRNYLLLRLHRAENIDSEARVSEILNALGSTGKTVIFPVHPRSQILGQFAKIPSNLRLVEPVGYFDWCRSPKAPVLSLPILEVFKEKHTG